MAKLYFRYGAMGSSKTANAIMVQYNYGERNQKVLMVKPQLENRDGARIIRSRSGLETECVFAEELEGIDLKGYDCVIVDEAQFLTKAQVEYLVHIVDDLGIPVIAYGLRADFKGNFFEGSMWMMACADTIEEGAAKRLSAMPGWLTEKWPGKASRSCLAEMNSMYPCAGNTGWPENWGTSGNRGKRNKTSEGGIHSCWRN